MSNFTRDTSSIIDVVLVNSDEEHSLPPSAVFRRRAQALIISVGFALKPQSSMTPPGSVSDRRAMSELVSFLIQLATVQGENHDNKLDNIAEAARASIPRVLSVMSAADFIIAVLAMLESEEQTVSRNHPSDCSRPNFVDRFKRGLSIFLLTV